MSSNGHYFDQLWAKVAKKDYLGLQPRWASRINLWGKKWYPCIDDNVDNKIDIIIDVIDNNVDTNNIDIDTIDINIDINIDDTNNIDIDMKSINLSNFKIWNYYFTFTIC